MLTGQTIPTKVAAAVVCLLSATLVAAQQAGEQAPGSQKFAIESTAFDVVVDRSRRLTTAEQELLMRLLAEDGKIPLSEQKRAARQLVGERREKMSEFADRSDSEFLTEDLLRAPNFYRGKMIELRGYTRLVGELPGGPADESFDHYYRMTLYVEEGDSSPVDVYFLELPENWPERADVIDDLSVVGRFVKLVEYDDHQTGQPAVMPLIVAQRVEFQPKIEAGNVVVNPALWEGVVRHKKKGWTNAERDLYYRILKHARDGDYTQQQKQARKNLRARIERYRTDAEKERDELHARAERYLKAHPDDKAEFQRQRNAADRGLRRKLRMYQQFRDDPKLFPLYADIVLNDHTAYNGKLITLRGRVRDISRFPADDKIHYDLETLYELWFYTEDSQAHPTVAICTSLPPGLLAKMRDEGERLDEPILVTGYFFKLYVYRAQDTDRFAPMLLAKQVTWQPVPVKKDPRSAVYLLPLIALLIAGVGYFFWRTRVEDRMFREQLAIAEQQPMEVSFDQVQANPELIQPSFDQIEAAEEPHFRDHGKDNGSTL